MSSSSTVRVGDEVLIDGDRRWAIVVELFDHDRVVVDQTRRGGRVVRLIAPIRSLTTIRHPVPNGDWR